MEGEGEKAISNWPQTEKKLGCCEGRAEHWDSAAVCCVTRGHPSCKQGGQPGRHSPRAVLLKVVMAAGVANNSTSGALFNTDTETESWPCAGGAGRWRTPSVD